MSVPVLSWLLIAEGMAPNTTEAAPGFALASAFQADPAVTTPGPPLPRKRSAGSPERVLHLRSQDPNDPALRANPFPEVTDLFCRLPLPTLFYRLEATHLGDLMRL